jgi:hypothetical protein
MFRPTFDRRFVPTCDMRSDLSPVMTIMAPLKSKPFCAS